MEVSDCSVAGVKLKMTGGSIWILCAKGSVASVCC